jgi:hypothetical protein
MIRCAILLSLLSLMPANPAAAEACRLDHATYLESRSGAIIRFRPKNETTDATLTIGLFQMRLPGISEEFEGDITWNAGSHARPDGAISRTCAADEDDEGGICSLWSGNVYSLGNSSAGLIENADMPAPKALLLADFGRSLTMTEAFTRAHPERAAFDVFLLTGCGK